MIVLILFIVLWIIFALEPNIETSNGVTTLWYTSISGKRKYIIVRRGK